jgi:hypothetical protein
MSGEGSQGNREVPPTNRPLEEGDSGGKHGFPPGSEPEASDAAGFVEIAALESELVAARSRKLARA